MLSKHQYTAAMIAQCVKEAKAAKGVKFDARICRFTAQAYNSETKRQRWLGSFHTAAEASEAYRAAPETQGRQAARTGSFRVHYQAWLDKAPKNAKGYPAPVPGHCPEFCPEGDVEDGTEPQLYYLDDREDGDGETEKEREETKGLKDGVVVRTPRGKPEYYFQFQTTCRTEGCGGVFYTRVSTNPSYPKGITRNCELHRKPDPFKAGREARKTERVLASGKKLQDATPTPNVADVAPVRDANGVYASGWDPAVKPFDPRWVSPTEGERMHYRETVLGRKPRVADTGNTPNVAAVADVAHEPEDGSDLI